MKLNIGCGNDIRQGYINIDIRLFSNIDMILDLNTPLPFKNFSIDEILAIDILEHLSRKWSRRVLIDWINKLKVGGVIFIQCPDILELYRLFSKDNFSELERRLYGEQDYEQNKHLSGFTLEEIVNIFKGQGLEILQADHINGNLQVKAIKR